MPMHDTEIASVYCAQNLAEAEFLKNILADAGIEARVVGEAMIWGGASQIDEGIPSVWVRHVDETRAREILDDYVRRRDRPRSDDDRRPAWKCSACGELVEEDFELCWNCQNPRTPS
jgi:hypothetical protein